VDGIDKVIGGTSAGAPLYAGMMLNINAAGSPGNQAITPLNAWMYARANDSDISMMSQAAAITDSQPARVGTQSRGSAGSTVKNA